MPSNDLVTQSRRVGRWAVVLAALCLPITTAGVAIAMGAATVCWLISLRPKEDRNTVAKEPVLWVWLALWLWVGVGIVYAETLPREAFSEWLKYRKLLYIPIVYLLLDDEAWFERLCLAFLVGCSIVAVLALSQALGLHGFGKSESVRAAFGWSVYKNNFYIFKSPISQSLVAAWGFFVATLLAMRTNANTLGFEGAGGKGLSRGVVPSWLLWLACVLCASTVFALTKGRTGLVAGLLLGGLVLLARCPRRYAVPVIIAVGLVVGTWGLTYEPLRETLNRTLSEATAIGYQPGNSIGVRQGLWGLALELWRSAPVLGHGTGGLSGVALALPGGGSEINVHQQYLQLAASNGFVGLLLFVFALAATFVRATPWQRLRGLMPWSAMLTGLVVWMAFASLFNTSLRDVTEGSLFCIFLGALLRFMRRA